MAGTPDGIGFVVVGPVQEDVPTSEAEDNLSFVVVGPVTDRPRLKSQESKNSAASGRSRRQATVKFSQAALEGEAEVKTSKPLAKGWSLRTSLRKSSLSSGRSAARVNRLDSVLPITLVESILMKIRSNAFESFWGGVIMLNTLVLVVETDHRDQEESGIGWVISDSMFTSLFLLELILRMAAMRQQWPRNPWNILDLLLVSSSVMDVWILPLLQTQFQQMRFLVTLRVVRLFRMLRILRLLRLLRHSQKLVLLVHALWGALRALFWAMVLVIVVLYVFALLLTRLTKTDNLLPGNPMVSQWMGTMPRSLFTLFQLMTLEGWPDIARETLDSSPWLTIFYIVFVLLTNITLLNTVAGVLVENVLKTSRMDDARQLRQQEQKMELEREVVAEELEMLDLNENGYLDLNELKAAAWNPEQAPHLTQFLKLGGISMDEAEELFKIVDIEDTGAISHTDFVEAARRARGSIKSKHLVALKRDLLRLDVELENVVSLLGKASEKAEFLVTAFSNDGDPPRESAGEGGVAELRREFREQLRAMEARLLGMLQVEGAEAMEARQIAPQGFCCSRATADEVEESSSTLSPP